MYWDDLNKDNIEEIKEYYYEYINVNKNTQYASNLMTFEEFIQEELVQCDKCNNWTCKENTNSHGGYLCNCCYDDEQEYDYIDPHDKYMDYKIENGEV